MAPISLPCFLFLSALLISRSMAMMSADKKYSTSFLRASCSRTLYADLCYSSLSPYADRVGHDPVLLALLAMNVTVDNLKPLSSYIDSLLQRTAAGPSSSSARDAMALKDCRELISDATDQVRKSEKELVGLEGMVGSQVTWRIGNAQTWMSAALTDEDTCTDGFGEGSGGTGDDAGPEVCQKVKSVMELTSNALALVNSLVNS